MNKCSEIFNECDNAVGVALNTLYKRRPDYFLLLLARGEYNAALGKIKDAAPYLLDFNKDLYDNHYQQEFIIHYINRNYKRDGFEYAEESDMDDLITEMMIYSHIWEDVGFLKLLLRMAEMLDGKEYRWITDLEYHNELYTTIQNKVVKPLIRQNLALGDLIKSAYSSHIRDAFAHSMYSIDFENQKIRMWGGRKEAKKWGNVLTFEEFQIKFLKTIRIWNQMYHLCDECLKLAANENLTGEIHLSKSKKMFIRAEWIKRGEIFDPYFRGVVTRNE